MLNRRILRIKVFKTVYAFAENPSMSLAQAQSQFDALCQGTRDLYLFMLALLPALTEHSRARIEAARNKFHPTEEERNPNMRRATAMHELKFFFWNLFCNIVSKVTIRNKQNLFGWNF